MHMNIHVCVPVLKRYDLLKELIRSLESGSVQPTSLVIIDNGRDAKQLLPAIGDASMRVDTFTPVKALGLAESWNWFIAHVPEERVIVNDDVVFAPESLEKMVMTPGAFVSALAGTNACSCFLLRDSCVQRVGMFDEAISPGYAYFEDCDYVERMRQLNLWITAVDCGVQHLGSQTIRANDSGEMLDHHRRFLIAQENYIAKWGRLPDGVVRQLT
jgi:GT2 family glycosyltransferase